MCWTRWKDIYQESGYNGCAIYMIRMKTDEGTAKIPRFLGIDEKGLLYIGTTENLETRRNQFINGRNRGNGHIGANLLYLLNIYTRIKRQFKNYTCKYSFKKLRKGLELGEQESREIKRYVIKFGEVPPLNSAIPLRNNDATW